MANKKRHYTPNWMTSKSNCHFSRLYDNMIFSPAFKALTKNQRLLLICMIQEYNPSTKVKHPDNDPNKFYFNKRIYSEKYGLYSNDRQFYKDRDELIKKGFIKQVVGGHTTRKKTIYQFSQLWQKWNEEDFLPNSNGWTASMLKRKAEGKL